MMFQPCKLSKYSDGKIDFSKSVFPISVTSGNRIKGIYMMGYDEQYSSKIGEIDFKEDNNLIISKLIKIFKTYRSDGLYCNTFFNPSELNGHGAGFKNLVKTVLSFKENYDKIKLEQNIKSYIKIVKRDCPILKSILRNNFDNFIKKMFI